MPFQIKAGCNIMTPKGNQLLKAGTRFDVGDYGFTKKHIQQHMDSGYIAEYFDSVEQRYIANNPDVLAEQIPGRDQPVPVPADPTAADPKVPTPEAVLVQTGNSKETGIVETGSNLSPGGPQPGVELPPSGQPEPRENANVNAAGQANGMWTLDPAVIAEKSLDELNAMIVERDDRFGNGMETREEAIALLSQDFMPKE